MALRGKSYVGVKLQTFAYFVYNASCAVSRCLGRFLLSVFLYAFPFNLTLSMTSISPQLDGVRLKVENYRWIQWAIFVASRSRGPNLVFHLSAAWPSWQPLWWSEKRFKIFRSLNLRLYFCVDFPSSSKLIGNVDLTDSYKICPKCSLVINAQNGVRLFWYSKYFIFYAPSIYEDPQIFNSPPSK